jgi:ATP-dependent protease ClpP protease subunit
MPDRPRYRYWGDHEPVNLGPIIDATASAEGGKKATMRVYGPIDRIGAPFGVSADDFGEALATLGDVESIELHIHSPGGSAFEGTAIKNQLQQHPATVNVVVDGLAASAASMIAMAGDTVTMAPSAQMMIHDASALVIGQAEEMRLAADMLDKLSQSYAEAYAAKAGGTADGWREAMQPETWYTAQEAVDAGLADRVMPKPRKSADANASFDFDLSIFAHAGRDDAPAPAMPAKASPKPPAAPPVVHPPKKGAVMLTDSEIKALCEGLDLPEDADAAAIQAKVAELAARPQEAGEPEITDEAIAAHFGVDAEKVKDAVDAAKSGKVAVSQTLLDELKANAAAGAAARTKQLEDERDEAVEAAVKAGKISRDRAPAWTTAWDKDPEGTKADLDSLEARFPVAKPNGYAGSDGSDGEATAAITDEEADALAGLAGVSKEALING